MMLANVHYSKLSFGLKIEVGEYERESFIAMMLKVKVYYFQLLCNMPFF